MAQRIRVELVDDLDGTEATRTMRFSLNGTSYEIDLSDENAERLEKAMAPWISSARRAGQKPRVVKPPASTRAPRRDREQTKAMREWANANGWQLGKTGRIPADVEAAWHRAHGAR